VVGRAVSVERTCVGETMTTPPGRRSSVLGDHAAIGVIATGVLVLSAPTAVQVIWLIAVVLVAALVARSGRRQPLDPDDPGQR
jgi:membrane protein implicated in regulation of membrane protease activity